MNTIKILKETYLFRLFHLFPHSRKYREMSESLSLSSPSLSSFLYSLRIREGRKALIASNLAYSLVSFLIAAFLDFYFKNNTIKGVELLVITLLYSLFLSIKFGFFLLKSFREVAEMLFALLSFYFTHYFVLTFLLIVLFENAEALSGEDIV